MKLFLLLPAAMAMDPPASEIGNLPEALWPRLRHIVASNITLNAGYDASSPEDLTDLFESAMAAFPEDGNCWCYPTKAQCPRGAPQDGYDFACNDFHKCIRCAKLEGDCDPEFNDVNIDYVSAGPISNGTSSVGLTTLSGDNSCGENISRCFEQLANEFINILEAELPGESSYTEPCTNLPTDQKGGGHSRACCGVAPTWKSYITTNHQCCPGSNEITDISTSCGAALAEFCETLINPIDTYIFEGSSGESSGTEVSSPACLAHGDLSFVIDVTGSMGGEIAAIKNGIAAVAANGDIGPGAPFGNGNIVLYGDPSASSRVYTSDVTTFTNAANAVNTCQVSETINECGGDCPEAAFNGVQTALGVIDECSSIYVITDANAMDFSQSIIDLAISKRTKINFVLTSTCSSSGSIPHTGVDSNYPSAADQTGGTIFHITKANVASELPTIVETAALLGSGGGAVEEFTAGTNDITLIGTNAITSMEITVNGNAGDLSCVDVNGDVIPESEYEVLLDISTAKIIKVPRISSGGDLLWDESLTCSTSATEAYSVVVAGTYEGCHPDYCQNGGTCESDDTCNLFNCICPSGFSGYMCHIDDSARSVSKTSFAQSEPLNILKSKKVPVVAQSNPGN